MYLALFYPKVLYKSAVSKPSFYAKNFQLRRNMSGTPAYKAVDIGSTQTVVRP